MQTTTPRPFVAGRTAHAGERCDRCPVLAVSAFEIGDKPAGLACERHIIAVHELAERSLSADRAYQRGAPTTRVNASRVPLGARVLLERTAHGLVLARRKTDAKIAAVIAKRRGGFRRYVLVTDLGDVDAAAAEVMWTVA